MSRRDQSNFYKTLKGDATPIPGSVSDDDNLSQCNIQDGEYCNIHIILKTLFQDDDLTYTNLFKCVQLYGLGLVSLKEFDDVISKVFGDRNAEREKEKLLKVLKARNISRRKLSWCCRPSADLTQARCKRIGSYLMLPEEYPAIISTGREGKLSMELNDAWISVASGSEDFSFKIYRKNIYEEQLTKCEDDRFEHDMAINYCQFAIECMQNILRELPNHLADNDTYNFLSL